MIAVNSVTTDPWGQP